MTRVRHATPSLRHLFDPLKTSLERAFEIAGSGNVMNVTELLIRLNSEGYMTEQIQGKQLRRQLTAFIEEARVP
jgi:hypothetical protein